MTRPAIAFSLPRIRQGAARWISNRLRWLLAQVEVAALDQANRDPDQSADVYLFVAINGAGLGHLTRCLGIAKALERRNSSAVIVFFTTSLGMAIVHRFGYQCYHVPPFAQLDERFVNANRWNDLFANHLREVVSIYRPKRLVFDGTYAYGGLQRVIRENPAIPCLWVRRAGMASHNEESIVAQSDLFRSVVVPGDLLTSERKASSTGNITFSPPVVLLEPHELLSRTAAREELSIGLSDKVVYVQLGAGNINELSSLEAEVLAALREVDQLLIVLSTSPIALEAAVNTKGIKHISSYPNSRYFNAFDFAVLAAGYNSVNECVAHGLPAVFIPNMQTQSDDQMTRAQHAATWDGWFVWDGGSSDDLKRYIAELCQRSGRASASNMRSDGADVIAGMVHRAV